MCYYVLQCTTKTGAGIMCAEMTVGLYYKYIFITILYIYIYCTPSVFDIWRLFFVRAFSRATLEKKKLAIVTHILWKQDASIPINCGSCPQNLGAAPNGLVAGWMSMAAGVISPPCDGPKNILLCIHLSVFYTPFLVVITTLCSLA